MSYFLRSIKDEYDEHGNYIGNSAEGNQFHGVGPSVNRVLSCSGCGSTQRREHPGGGTVCASCGCGAAQWNYRQG